MTGEGGNVQYQIPMGPIGYGGYGNDMFGGNYMWFLLIWMAMFGWGNGGFGGFGNGGGATGYVANDVQRGFDQSAIMTSLDGIKQGQCNGFAGVSQAMANGFAQAEIAANSRQMADMNQNFGMQAAIMQGNSGLQAAIEGVKYTIATEECNTRNANAMNTRDIIDNDNRNYQNVMNKLCQLELDGYKQQVADRDSTISQLRTQLAVASDREFTNAQTATIQAGQRVLANEIEQYVVPTPRPAYIVQNPNCCNPNAYGYACS